MDKPMHAVAFAAGLLMASGAALAKLPPPPPMDPAKKEAADEKKKVADEKTKQELMAAEEATVKNYQSNMKKAGKPVPKPVPTSGMSTPPKGGKPKPEANTQKASAKKG